MSKLQPGLDNLRRCALKRHQNLARHVGSKSRARIFILPPLSGRIFAW
jgi:hypothetical protein